MPAGQLYINDQDAYTTWGVSLSNEALTALMTPPPVKDWITNEVRNEDGTRYIQGANVPKVAERTLTLPINLTAPDEGTFYSRYAAFCAVLAGGILTIRTEFADSAHRYKTTYKLLYKSCTQFTQFARQMATFGLSLVEPDPTDRTTQTVNLS